MKKIYACLTILILGISFISTRATYGSTLMNMEQSLQSIEQDMDNAHLLEQIPANTSILINELEDEQKASAIIHYKSISDAHPDYEEKLYNVEFVKYLIALDEDQYVVAKDIIKYGIASDVVELISSYKENNKLLTTRMPHAEKDYNDYRKELKEHSISEDGTDTPDEIVKVEETSEWKAESYRHLGLTDGQVLLGYANPVRTEFDRYNTITKEHPDYEGVISSPKFLEYLEHKPKNKKQEILNAIKTGSAKKVISLLWQFKIFTGQSDKRQPELPPKEYKSGILSNYSGYKLEESDHFNKIAKVHPDFLEIVINQKFKDYINNLPSQQHKIASKIIEAGTTEEVIGLMSRYAKQVDYQDSHRSMITEMVKDYKGPNRKLRAMEAIQSWINKYEDISDNPRVINLKIRETDSNSLEQTYLVNYTIASEANKQKYLYEVNPFADTVRAISMEQ